MQSILRDDIRQSADAVRASTRAFTTGANIEQPEGTDIVGGDEQIADAPFLLVVVDTAGRRFSLEGPMIDATEWRNVIHLTQRVGDRFVCFIKAGSSRFHMARLAQKIRLNFGYRHVASGSIVRPAHLRRLTALSA